MAQKGGKLPDRVPEIAILREDAEGDVTLTLKKGKFAEFLFGFLGAKETLSKNYRHDFTVKLEDLLQFHYLLIQKIEKEQFISMALETATVQYDDDTNRTINTFESIEKYSEHRDVGVRGFELSWNFVFKTPNQQDVQQQKVNVFFETNDASAATGSIAIKIEHTNQVWAAEVLRLFEEHINKLVIRYNRIYRVFRLVKRFAIIDVITVVCVLFIIAGGIYVLVQRSALSEPRKTESEFIFDISQVLMKNKYQNNIDTGLLLQFFLLRDLRNGPRDIVSELQEEGLFNSKYKVVVDKLASGYYDNGKKSDRIVPSFDALMAEIKAKENIRWAYSYLKFALVYLVVFSFAVMYLKLFRMQSILALTTKGIKQMKKQEKEKSTLIQFIFGVTASLVAAIIYEYTIRLLLLR